MVPWFNHQNSPTHEKLGIGLEVQTGACCARHWIGWGLAQYNPRHGLGCYVLGCAAHSQAHMPIVIFIYFFLNFLI